MKITEFLSSQKTVEGISFSLQEISDFLCAKKNGDGRTISFFLQEKGFGETNYSSKIYKKFAELVSRIRAECRTKFNEEIVEKYFPKLSNGGRKKMSSYEKRKDFLKRNSTPLNSPPQKKLSFNSLKIGDVYFDAGRPGHSPRIFQVIEKNKVNQSKQIRILFFSEGKNINYRTSILERSWKFDYSRRTRKATEEEIKQFSKSIRTSATKKKFSIPKGINSADQRPKLPILNAENSFIDEIKTSNAHLREMNEKIVKQNEDLINLLKSSMKEAETSKQTLNYLAGPVNIPAAGSNGKVES